MEAIEKKEENGMVITFKKPYMFEGKEYTQIDLSGMENMTGNDMISLNRIMGRNLGESGEMVELSTEYAMHFAARAAELPVEFFHKLPAKEVMRVKLKVRNFLFG